MASDGTDGTSAGRGRPSRPAPATIENGLVYLRMRNCGLKPDLIASREGVARSTVFNAIKLAEKARLGTDATDAEAADRPLFADGGEAEARPPRRLSLSTVRRRASEYADNHPTMTLGVAENDFWVRVVMAVHKVGDGHCLGVGRAGCQFATRAELATLVQAGHFCAGDSIDVEGWLAKLFFRGRLIDHEDGDIGIPAGLGLVPGETARGVPVRRRAIVQAPARPLPFGLQLVKGDRMAGQNGDDLSDEIPPDPSGNNRIYPDETRNLSGLENGIYSDSEAAARTAAAYAYASDIRDKGSSSSIDSRANEAGLNPDSESGKNHRNETAKAYVSQADGTEESGSGRVEGGESAGGPESDETADKRSTFAKLVDDALQAGGLKRRPKPAESGLVNEWLKKLTAEQILHVITNKMKENPELRVSRLKYFDPAMEDFLEVRHRRPARKSGSPATGGRSDAYDPTGPLSPADQAIKDLIDPAVQAWRADLHGCPWPPMLDDFKRAIGAGDGTLAHRWLDVWAAWDQAKRPAVLKPPPFPEIANADFAARLDECEDGLSAPDDPDDE